MKSYLIYYTHYTVFLCFLSITNSRVNSCGVGEKNIDCLLVFICKMSNLCKWSKRGNYCNIMQTMIYYGRIGIYEKKGDKFLVWLLALNERRIIR